MEITILIALVALNIILVAVNIFFTVSRGKSNNAGNNDLREVNGLINQLFGALESYRKGLKDEMQFLRQSQGEKLENVYKLMTELDNRVSGNLAQIRSGLDNKLKEVRESNEKSLELMRQTVDEKLTVNLEQKLTGSFSQINERLEAVYKGLGEMQVLASGVSDLKKVLTNVKTRGTWGEVALDSMLSQLLAPEQYARSVKLSKIDGEDRMVDFAVVMPGKDKEFLYLPIDAKFPLEDYQRLVDASESGDVTAVDAAVKALTARIKLEANNISSYYIRPPKTTDFAIMYLPIEGLYAEVIRRTGLAEELQTRYRVIVSGPTTLAALLNSLQMGFKTLAIEKHSKEIQKLFSAFKMQFSRFCTELVKTKKKLSEVTKSIDVTSQRAQKISDKLSAVENITGSEANELIGIEDDPDVFEDLLLEDNGDDDAQ